MYDKLSIEKRGVNVDKDTGRQVDKETGKQVNM